MGGQAPDTRFFGHPLGLAFLSGTELWERFSFYGMQAILMLYMTQSLLVGGRADHVLGLETFRRMIGAPTDLAFAAQVFGLYSGMIYVTPLLGSWLGDRVLGKTRTVTIGALVMSAGHFAMASEQLFLVALLLIIVGSGCLIGNMASQVGLLYAPGDERRTRAFGLYLIALNVGALMSPLVIGTLGEKVGWHWGFGAAGVGMLCATAFYLSGHRHLPPDRLRTRAGGQKLTAAEWRSVMALVLTFAPWILSIAALQQAYGLMYVWADTAVDHRLLGWEVPITWLGVIDGLMTIASVFLATSIWKRLAARGREPGDIAKLGIGCLLIGAAYLFIASAAMLVKVPLVLLILFYAILDFGTAWVDPPTNALVSRNAPPQVNATMIALLKLATAGSYFLLGWLGRFFEPLSPPRYWALTAGLSLAGFVLVWIFGSAVARMMVPAPAAPPPIADAGLLTT